MTNALQRLRATFDDVALLYDRVRPGYPEAAFDDLTALAGIAPGARVLEVGCGTGQATLPLARRGCRITCVELGAELAAVARRNLAPYPQVDVQVDNFETWPVAPGAYDLVMSATAFHWIDPAIRYQKTARALRPGGALALMWNHHVKTDADAGFFDAVRAVYAREAPEKAKKWEPLITAEELGTPALQEIKESGLFDPAEVRTYRWDLSYDAAGYADVLNTYSDHRDQPAEERERLLRGIGDFIDAEYGGRITKGYLTILYVARRS